MEIKINVSLACWPAKTYFGAACASQGAEDSFLGKLSFKHTQICPQNRGRLTEETASDLMTAFPETQFRLHANVRLHKGKWSPMLDASTYDPSDEYWEGVAEACKWLKAPAYTWHAGSRLNATIYQVLARTLDMEDRLGIHVGIEGMYPTKGETNRWLLSTWNEYKILLESRVKYALDLSHLNIVATRFGREDNLVREMLASENCIEVHISGNNGMADTHETLDHEPWWYGLLQYTNKNATVFTESNMSKQ